MAEFEGMDEATLRALLDQAENYDERAKIRAAIREIRKASGLEKRRATGKSSYVRPGMGLNSPSITIPNSVTGNVLPSKLVGGAPVKVPDKNTPTIGYLNSQTTQSKKTRHNSSDQSAGRTFESQVPNKEEGWWRRSRESSLSTSTTGNSPEPNAPLDNRSSEATTGITRTPSPSTELSTSLQANERSVSPEIITEQSISEQSVDPEQEVEPEQEIEPEQETEPEQEIEPEQKFEPEQEVEPEKEVEDDPPVEYSPEPDVKTNENENHISVSPVSDELIEQNEDNKIIDDDDYDENDDEEVEELKKLQDDDESDIAISADATVKLEEHLRHVEPGLGEDFDFRKKLRRAEEAKIDTKAAFPQSKGKGEQVDFRNVLRKSEGPDKKAYQSGSSAQVDFRNNLRTVKDNEEFSSNDNVNVQEVDVGQEQAQQQESVIEQTEEISTAEIPEPSKEPDSVTTEIPEPSKEPDSVTTEIPEPSKEPDSVTNTDMDSYEARREARRKAREERRKKAAEEEKTMSYREKQKLEQSKRIQDNKKKWAEMDGANGESPVEKPTIQKQKSTGTQQLLAWCQHKTRYYENVQVKDFSSSWSDGLALCAVLHSFMPDVIPYDDLSADNPRQNFTIALDAADAAGIGAFFDVDDIMLAKTPDPKSMMTFLATIYQHFK